MKKLVMVIAFVALSSSRARAAGTVLDGVDLADFNAGEGDHAGQRTQEILNDAVEGWSRSSTLGSGIANGLSQIQSAMSMFGALSDLDRELSNRIQDDHSGPEVPSSCSGGGSGAQCAECFRRAYGEVNFTRITLERLRTIVSRTLAYIRAAEGFGDSVSGVHGISGLSWQYAKADVEKAKRDFIASSRTKYDGLIGNMRRALDMVAACERDNFHNPDWYSRYGFMYFQFVKESYAIHE